MELVFSILTALAAITLALCATYTILKLHGYAFASTQTVRAGLDARLKAILLTTQKNSHDATEKKQITFYFTEPVWLGRKLSIDGIRLTENKEQNYSLAFLGRNNEIEIHPELSSAWVPNESLTIKQLRCLTKATLKTIATKCQPTSK